jgi:hypothetical protein
VQFEEQYIVFLQASSYRHSNVHPVLFAFACRLCSFMLISSRFMSHIFKSYRHTAYVALITTEIFFFFFADGIRRLVHCYTICIKKKKRLFWEMILCICYGLLYMKNIINSLCFLTLPCTVLNCLWNLNNFYINAYHKQ